MKGALKRQWEREMAVFRGDARLGQRLGVVVGLMFTVVVICVSVWSVVAGQNA